jgi:hypothetical protein
MPGRSAAGLEAPHKDTGTTQEHAPQSLAIVQLDSRHVFLRGQPKPYVEDAAKSSGLPEAGLHAHIDINGYVQL